MSLMSRMSLMSLLGSFTGLARIDHSAAKAIIANSAVTADGEADAGGNAEHDERPVLDLVGDPLDGVAAERGGRQTAQALFQISRQVFDGGHFVGSRGFRCARGRFLTSDG